VFPLFYSLVNLVVDLFNVSLQLGVTRLLFCNFSLLHCHWHRRLLGLLFGFAQQSILISIKSAVPFVFWVLRHLEIVKLAIIWIFLISHVVASVKSRWLYLLLPAIELLFFLLLLLRICTISFIVRGLLDFDIIWLDVNWPLQLSIASCGNILATCDDFISFDLPLLSYKLLLVFLGSGFPVTYLPSNSLCFFCVIEFVAICLSLTDNIFDRMRYRSGIFALNLCKQLCACQFLLCFYLFWFVRKVLDFNFFSRTSANYVFCSGLSNCHWAWLWSDFYKFLLAVLLGSLRHPSKRLLRLQWLLLNTTWGKCRKLFLRTYRRRHSLFLVFVVLLLVSHQGLRNIRLLGLILYLRYFWLFHCRLLQRWLQVLLNSSSCYSFNLVLFVLDLGVPLLLIRLGTWSEIILSAIVEVFVQVSCRWRSVLRIVNPGRNVSRWVLLKSNWCVVLAHLRRVDRLWFVFKVQLRFGVFGWSLLLSDDLKRLNFRTSWQGSSINTRFDDSYKLIKIFAKEGFLIQSLNNWGRVAPLFQLSIVYEDGSIYGFLFFLLFWGHNRF